MTKPQRPKTPQELYDEAWFKRFNELNYHIYFNTEAGKEWLQMCEHRFFYAPVCIPGVDRSFADHNEGRNEFLRAVRRSGQGFMVNPKKADEPQKVNRERK